MSVLTVIFVLSLTTQCAAFLPQRAHHSSSITRNTLKSLNTKNVLKMASDNAEYALLFDCDGVIVETEVSDRDLEARNWVYYCGTVWDS